MKPTNANVFIDSNVVLYLLDNSDSRKKLISLSIAEGTGFISSQVIFESLNVSLKKLKLSKSTAVDFVKYLMHTFLFQDENISVIEKALLIFSTYGLQAYDSKIVASALEAGCTTLYSEDMQHGLVIENTLTIINPFLISS